MDDRFRSSPYIIILPYLSASHVCLSGFIDKILYFCDSSTNFVFMDKSEFLRE